MTPIKQLLSTYKISFKTAVVIWGVVLTVFHTNAAFHDGIMAGYALVPSGIKGFFFAVLPVGVALYEARSVIVSTIQKQ